ncbi:MAG: tRNA (adenosine(37)-N6)-threonylcarbamoyltransferase complex dimerization subunit type 1 TsaB [Synergistaceae bacterium]|nr:tRNA (adenosine(37)-N6)-threonylcarbamoyltransferase complex dimerization subunit type 1 TsaB [Synergistaceae bacterium]
MKNFILALDCSLRWTNAAVFEDGEVLASERLDIGRRQAAELPLVVERVLKETNRSFKDIGLVAVTNGPGYFTGIRVGASYAAALAYGLGVKVAPVSTLRMLAYPYTGKSKSRPVLALVYAGKGRVYAASFGCAQYGNTELPPGEYGGDQLGAWLQENPEEILLVSDDPEKAAETSGLTSREILLSPADAAVVAAIAAQMLEASYADSRSNDSIQSIAFPAAFPIVSPMELKIFYHRNPQVG